MPGLTSHDSHDRDICSSAGYFRRRFARRGASVRGSGLGLAIAQEIMKRMGGHIVVRSAPGQGSEFAFLVRTREGTEKTEDIQTTEGRE